MTKIEVLMKKTILCLLPLLGSLLPSSLFGETNIGAGHEYDNIRLSGPVLHAEKSLPASLRLLPNQTIKPEWQPPSMVPLSPAFSPISRT